MRKTYFIHKDFEIYSVEDVDWKKDSHRHNFFELLYIAYGSGYHTLNQNKHAYAKGNIFLLTPDDIHSFEMVKPTQFHCLRFLPGFFSTDKEGESLKNLLSYHNQTQGNIILDKEDEAFSVSLILKIINEASVQNSSSQLLIKHLMFALIQLISRYVEPVEAGPSKVLRIDNIMAYVRSNIANPDQLKKEALANHFNVSPNYIGEYFKKHLQISLRAYITKLKLNLIDKRLKKSNQPLSQIALDLGFADSSHFTHFVKQATGKTPSLIRNESVKRQKFRF